MSRWRTGVLAGDEGKDGVEVALGEGAAGEQRYGARTAGEELRPGTGSGQARPQRWTAEGGRGWRWRRAGARPTGIVSFAGRLELGLILALVYCMPAPSRGFIFQAGLEML